MCPWCAPVKNKRGVSEVNATIVIKFSFPLILDLPSLIFKFCISCFHISKAGTTAREPKHEGIVLGELWDIILIEDWVHFECWGCKTHHPHRGLGSVRKVNGVVP